jgi:uncharacterized protein YutE (UPF0331/DUF86 family)
MKAMSDKSPLFVSALELLAHATELYTTGHARRYKFVILHLANSVELILKDCLIDHGKSIYKNSKETITIWGAFEELDKLDVVINEKPVIELLIDDRNTIQHRFGFPDAESVYYYLEQVVAFFNLFLYEQYGVKLSEALGQYLTKEQMAVLGLESDNFAHLRRLFKISPEAAVQQAYADLEVKLSELLEDEVKAMAEAEQPIRRMPLTASMYMPLAIRKGLIPREMAAKFDELRVARNRAAHMPSSQNKGTDWSGALDTAVAMLTELDKAKDTIDTGQK